MAGFKITRVGVGAQLLLLVLVIACLTGGLVGVKTTDNARVALRNSALDRSLDAADLASSAIHEWVAGAQTGARDLAGRAVIRQAIVDDDATLTYELQQWLPKHPRLANVSIVDLHGVVRIEGKAAQPDVVAPTSIGDRSYFLRVLSTHAPAQSGPARSGLDGPASAPYAVPVDDSTGHLRAILVAYIDLSPLSDTLAHQGDISLFDLESGMVLAAPDPRQILQRPIIDQSTLNRLANVGRGTLELNASADQPAQLVAFAVVPDLPWEVLVQQPSVQAFAAVQGMIQQNVLLVGAVLLFAAGLGIYWAWRIIHPLRALRAAAEAMAAGDLSRRAGVARDDEIGDLGRAFDNMADRLEVTIADLEAVVVLAEEREGRIRAVMDSVADGILTIDPDGRIVSCNASAERMFGYRSSELHGLATSVLLDSDLATTRLPAQEGAAALSMARKQDGEQFTVELALSTVRINGVDHSILVVRDATERHRFEERLRHQAFHDALTGLPNRALFLDRLESALTRGRREARAVGVLFVDLDDFKLVNDSLGHGAGDLLLVDVARRLRASVRASDTVARLGGDEFAVLLEDDQGLESSTAARRIVTALRDPLIIDGHTVVASASIGIAFSQPDHDQPQHLMNNADTALYQAKARGKACFAVFSETLETEPGVSSPVRR